MPDTKLYIVKFRLAQNLQRKGKYKIEKKVALGCGHENKVQMQTGNQSFGGS